MLFTDSPACRVFYYFQEICGIPHGSGNTKEISDYCVRFAKEHGLEYYQDELNNVIIIREAAPGYESHRPYVIQGHLDMVCEQEKGRNMDFANEGLELYEEKGFLKARGTTLGADDGIAVAYMLALLEKEDLKSPRIEAVFTTEEETGMDGAKGIDLSPLQGKDMLNLDSEEEGIFLCGCAGGLVGACDFDLAFRSEKGMSVNLTVGGLEGGHSGSEIDKEHGNAILLLGRVLRELRNKCPLYLEKLKGGVKNNAIPREAKASFLISPQDRDLCVEYAGELENTLKQEYKNTEKDLHILLEFKEVSVREVLEPQCQQRILDFLYLAPNGVQHTNTDIRGLVETSLNAGIMESDRQRFHISFSIRSSVKSRKELVSRKLKCLAEALGGHYTATGDYPAWEYRSQSPLRENMCSVYEELFGEKPQITVIHAGLECGLFAEKIPDLDCVSFGPQIDDIHTPREKLSIKSTEKIWEFLIRFLEKGNL